MSMNTWMLISALAVLLLILIENIWTRKIGDRLTAYLLRGQYDEYAILRNKGMTKYLIPSFNLVYMDMNKAIAQNDRAGVEECLELYDGMRLSRKQKSQAFSRAFYYYVLLKDSEKATRYYRLTRDFSDAAEMKDMDIFFDTFVQKGYTYLKEVKTRLETVPRQELSDYESLLSQMYANKGDTMQAEKYRQLAEQHFAWLRGNDKNI